MSSLLCAGSWRASVALALAVPALAVAQNSFEPLGGEYSIAGSAVGDQMAPSIALRPTGGWIVWQDNATDGSGLGISARKLNAFAQSVGASFRVNTQGTNDQGAPQITSLPNGGAVVVWQGSQRGNWDIYARFINPDGSFLTSDLLVNSSLVRNATTTNSFLDFDQTAPVATTLADGRVVVVWTSFEQDGDAHGLFGQVFAADGTRVGGEFGVNLTAGNDQRSPAVTALANTNFAVAWLGEVPRDIQNREVNVYSRVFDSTGVGQTGETQVDATADYCSNPSIAGIPGGGFMVAWSQKSAVQTDPYLVVPANGWDVFSRPFTLGGKASAAPTILNASVYGSQYAPRLAATGDGLMAVWTSIGQDGSQEGVVGRFLSAAAQTSGDEFIVNSLTNSSQRHPSVAGDSGTRLVVAWTGFTGIDAGFELSAQAYQLVLPPLNALPAPSVAAVSSSRFSVTWPEVSATNLVGYEVTVDDAALPLSLTSNLLSVGGFTASSAHTFRLAYRLADGRVSPASAPTVATTWGEDSNFDGVPDDWQTIHWGANSALWPSLEADSDGDGMSNRREFLAGTSPLNRQSVLRSGISRVGQGREFSWATQPGSLYQVQSSSDLLTWQNVGGTRYATGNADAVPMNSAGSRSFYRVIRLR